MAGTGQRKIPWFSSGTVDAPEPGQNAANAGVLEKAAEGEPELTLLDFMRLTAEGNEELEVEFDRDQTWQRCSINSTTK